MSEQSEKIEVGRIVEGEVLRIKPFGAIILLPDNRQGLVHISHISASFVQDIADYLQIGDKVKVKVLSIDAATGKIALSMKEAADPAPGRGEPPRRKPKPTGGFADYKPRQSAPITASSSFEDKFKDWLKTSNERQADLNKRNKRK